MAKFTIPADTDPRDVADAVGQFVVEHSQLTNRFFSSVAEEIKSRISPKVLEVVMNQQDLSDS